MIAVTAGLIAAGCAREEAPPGNLPDTRPPQIVATRPENGAVVPGFDESLRIQFDEPVNVSRSYLRQVEASPAWRLRTEFGFSDLRVRPEGGWREGVVYTFHFPPDLADILGNRREEGFDLRFSTGPAIVPTRAFGRLRRRLDGSGLRDGRVIFLSEAGDSVPYSAVSDTGGAFELESLPPGRYTAWGFEDLNANLTLDRRLEPYDSVPLELADSTSAARISLHVVEPDTTPPILAVAEAVDSVTVRVEFDDPLEPEQDTASVRIAVTDTATGRTWPVEAWAVGGLEQEEAGPAASDTAGQDTVAVDSAGADTTAVEADTTPEDTVADEAPAAPDTGRLAGLEGARRGVRPGAAGLQEAGAGADSLSLPSREVSVRLGRPLEDGVVYRIRAEGFRNLRKLTGRGDTTFVYRAAEDSARADSAVADSAAGVDTAAATDTTPPPSATDDTAGVVDTTTVRDTAAPPDTTSVASRRRGRRRE